MIYIERDKTAKTLDSLSILPGSETLSGYEPYEVDDNEAVFSQDATYSQVYPCLV